MTKDEIDALHRELDERHARNNASWPLWKSQANWRRIREIGDTLAEEFGRVRGWRLSRSDVVPRLLVRRGVHLGQFRLGNMSMDIAVWDHPYSYRLNRHAVGVAVHLYGSTDRAMRWAAAVGLKATIPPERSWWFPPDTTLVLYEPALAEAGRG